MNHVLVLTVAAACAWYACTSRDLLKERNTARQVAARALTRLVILRIAAERDETA